MKNINYEDKIKEIDMILENEEKFNMYINEIESLDVSVYENLDKKIISKIIFL